MTHLLIAYPELFREIVSGKADALNLPERLGIEPEDRLKIKEIDPVTQQFSPYHTIQRAQYVSDPVMREGQSEVLVIIAKPKKLLTAKKTRKLKK